MINTCQNCKWSYIPPDSDASPHVTYSVENLHFRLRCHPDGDEERDQAAEIPCLKWQMDDGGEM